MVLHMDCMVTRLLVLLPSCKKGQVCNPWCLAGSCFTPKICKISAICLERTTFFWHWWSLWYSKLIRNWVEREEETCSKWSKTRNITQDNRTIISAHSVHTLPTEPPSTTGLHYFKALGCQGTIMRAIIHKFLKK